MSKNFSYYLRTLHEMAGTLAKEKHKTALFYYTDFLLFYLRTGGTMKHYKAGQIYDLRLFESGRVLSYKRWEKVVRTFNDPKYICHFDNKPLFNTTFKPYIKRKWLYLKDSTYEEFAGFCSAIGEIIVKPTNDWQGNGIRKLPVTVQFTSEENYNRLKAGNVLIEEVIKQHPKMRFENKSVNTIRVVTLLDKKGRAKILTTVLRIGSGDSIVDNFCAGGTFFPIDPEYGYVKGRGMNHNYQRTAFANGKLMPGFQVPFWNDITDTVRKAATTVPQCRFIGWDVAVREDGIELIEGNHNPDYEFMEMAGEHCNYYEIMKEK